jgi:CDP-glucose 4,6-dehydratase
VEGVEQLITQEFWRDRRVFVTGHTGFKGGWLCEILRLLGARITGYSLDAPGDIRDLALLKRAFDEAEPEIVFHLAAQPIVLESYERPAYTFEANVQGTVNLLECIRQSDCVRSAVIITTDKVYRNNEWAYGYRENDALGGNDPYSASKACAELVTESYAASFLRQRGIAASTARAGNVIGGGDVAPNRIIPDCIRAAKAGKPIIVRNSYSVRPYQHVLEPLFAYLMIAEKQHKSLELAGKYNIGPSEDGCVTTGELVDMFCAVWKGSGWIDRPDPAAVHESGLLKLDCSLIRSRFRWKPAWGIRTAIEKTVEWELAEDKRAVTKRQIEEYLNDIHTD